MSVKIDTSVNLPTLITLGTLIVLVAAQWGSNEATKAFMQKQLDKHEIRLDHHDDLFEKFQQSQAAVTAQNKMLAEFIRHLPPPPRGHPVIVEDSPQQ